MSTPTPELLVIYLDRLTYLMDSLDDVAILLPPTPHSMSREELRIASACNVIRAQIQLMIGDVRRMT